MRRAGAALIVVAMLVSSLSLGLLLWRDHSGLPWDSTGADTMTGAPLPTPTRAPAEDPKLARFYGQHLDWSPCGDNRCAKLTVPMDYADPGGATLRLAVLEVPSSGKSLGPLVVNPGGPGIPGTDYAAAARRVFRKPILSHFDVVGFDPRGTGGSDPVKCLDTAGTDALIAADPDPETPAEGKALMRDYRQLGAACVRNTGPEINHLSTVDSARDMDILRAALGEPTLTYFGASYGTKLGATYAQLFPKRVGRFVLDGAMDVSLTPRELSLQQAAGFETALRAYVENCVQTTSDCFLGSTVDAGLARIREFLAAVDAHPLPTDDGRQLQIGNAFYGLIMPLYSRDYWIVLSSALRAAMAGDGTSLMQLSDLYNSRGPNGYTDNSVVANLVINCLDNPWSLRPRQVPAQVPAFERASPTFGALFAWGLVTCRGFPDRSGEPPLTIRAAGAAPIVVIGTTRDPATPFAWAAKLAAQLASGVLVKRDGDGHTGYNAGNTCVDDAVERYLVQGKVPQDGLFCPATG